MRFDEVTIENDDKGTKWTAKQCQLLGSFEIELWIRLRDAKISSASTGKIVCFVYSANTNWKNFTMDGIVDLPIKSNLLQSKPGSNAECLRLLRSLVIRAVKRVAKKDPVLSTTLQRVMETVKATGTTSYDKKFGDRKTNRARTASAQMFLRFGSHHPLVIVRIENRNKLSEEFVAHVWKSYNTIEPCPIRKLRWVGSTIKCIDAKNRQVFTAVSTIA